MNILNIILSSVPFYCRFVRIKSGLIDCVETGNKSSVPISGGSDITDMSMFGDGDGFGRGISDGDLKIINVPSMV